MRYGNRAGMETATAGAGTITLGAAVSKHQTFANAGIQNGDTVPYFIEDGNAWEIGTGVYSSTGPTLTRVLVESSTGSLLTLSGAAQVYIDAQASFFNAGSGREVLSANRTYYVRTDGSDSNNGLANTSGGAFLTIQKAINVALGTLDFGGFIVTIQIGDGTYTGAVTVGSGVGIAFADRFVIRGNNSTPGNVIVTNGANTFTGSGNASFTLLDMEIRSTVSGSCIMSGTGSQVNFGNIRFGASVSSQITTTASGRVQAVSNYSIVSGGQAHVNATGAGGYIRITGVTVTLTGTPAFTAFAMTSRVGLVDIFSNTFSGSATGSYYSAVGNGVIFTNGMVGNLPGNAVGTTSSGGQYL